MKPAAFITVLFLSLVALAHLLRLLFHVPMTAGTTMIPMWASILGVVGPAALAIWLWQEHKR